MNKYHHVINRAKFGAREAGEGAGSMERGYACFSKHRPCWASHAKARRRRRNENLWYKEQDMQRRGAQGCGKASVSGPWHGRGVRGPERVSCLDFIPTIVGSRGGAGCGSPETTVDAGWRMNRTEV